MSGRWKIKHPAMKPLAAEAATVFPPGQVTYEWIPRERNTHADRLANEAMDAGKRGEQWSPAASRADLDTPSAVPAPEGPPGDATAGAARVRAATTRTAAGRAAEARAAEAADGPPAPGGVADGPASTGRATESRDAGTSAERPAAAAGARAGGPGSSAAYRPVTDTPASGAGARAGASGGDAGLAAAAGADADRRAAQTVATPSSGWAPADMGAPATFVLLRHGETPLTPQKRFSGSGGSDPSLSDIGREQAEKVAAALARRGTVQAVVASPSPVPARRPGSSPPASAWTWPWRRGCARPTSAPGRASPSARCANATPRT